jgi:hypothetical protein
MKGQTEINHATASRTPFFTFLQAAIPFTAVTLGGSVVTAVCALFVYANAMDMAARDDRFLGIVIPGVLLSMVFGYIAARRAVQSDPERTTSTAFSLLRKYRRTANQAGADREAGQYHIGEQYLRDLLGRRGA